MSLRVLLTSVPLALATAAAPLAAPVSAAPLIVRSDVWVSSRTATTLTVCARGWVDDPTFVTGEWVLSIAGSVLFVPEVQPGAAFPQTCLSISSASVPAGEGTVSLTFAGGTGDVIGACTLTFAWAPALPINEVSGACTDGTA